MRSIKRRLFKARGHIGDAAFVCTKLRKQREQPVTAAIEAYRIEQEFGFTYARRQLHAAQLVVVHSKPLHQLECAPVIKPSACGNVIDLWTFNNPSALRDNWRVRAITAISRL